MATYDLLRKIPVRMFHWTWFMQDGYFGDCQCDNSRIILDYNSS
jgi:hypothetical protein